jgi:hypothetical protein
LNDYLKPSLQTKSFAKVQKIVSKKSLRTSSAIEKSVEKQPSMNYLDEKNDSSPLTVSFTSLKVKHYGSDKLKQAA